MEGGFCGNWAEKDHVRPFKMLALLHAFCNFGDFGDWGGAIFDPHGHM